MNLPKTPAHGDAVIKFANEVISWMRANTITSISGGRLKQTGNGVIIDVTPTKISKPRKDVLPFEVSSAGNDLTAAPGIFGNVEFEEIVKTDAADGTWRLYGKITLDPDNGILSGEDVAWYATAQTSTTTTFYHQIGRADITGGAATVSNSNYGPVNINVAGDVTNAWTVFFV